VEVPEPNCREGGESKVCDDQHVVKPRVVLKLEVVDETNVLPFDALKLREIEIRRESALGQIAKDEPEDSDEVTDGENNNDKLESLEEVRNHQDQHDVVVVNFTVLSKLWVILDNPFKLLIQKQFHLPHERVR